MIRFLISGEGGSDVGVSTNAPGPLVSAIRHVVETRVGDELGCEIIPKSALSAKSRSARGRCRKEMRLRGAKQKNGELLYLRAKAEALALLACDESERGAILFSDCDYTRSEVSGTMTKNFYLDVVKTIELGFRDANGFRYGVPMVPRPRSESWFLCHYQVRPYSKTYEDLPANDASSGDGKHLLANYFHCKPEVQDIYSHVNPDDVNWARIQAPSFCFFVRRLQNVAERLSHRATTDLEENTSIDFAEKRQLI